MKLGMMFAASSLLAVASIGCGGHKSKAGPSSPSGFEQPSMRKQMTTVTTLPSRAQTTLIKQGPLPMVHLVESAATLNVMDLTTNQRLASFAAPRHAILRIDASAGIVIGDT